ncbi:MAG: hypothetical protein J5656_00015 [Clostridia bacterium]|nr:hypothetical protein [Clostridia bacterium]
MALEKQHVLTKQEKAVMHLVYSISEKNNGMCLLTPIEIFEQLPLDLEIREEDLWPILRNLEIDDYFDVTPSDRKGELVYAINMHQKGLAYARVEKSFRNNLAFKVGLTVGLALLSGLVALGLRLLFHALGIWH